MSTPEPMAYIGRKPCGCFWFAAVDVPSMATEIAKEMRYAVKHGLAVERVTCAYVRANWCSSCDVCKPPKPARKTKTLKQETFI